MYFNSYEFLLFFLPVTLAGWFICGRWVGLRAAQGWLIAASMFFYASWNPWYLILLGSSTLANYTLGRALSRRASGGLRTGALLAFGVTANLCVLGYYKYANFFVNNLDALTGGDWVLGHVILPLGISFFTFQKIAFLVDCARGLVPRCDFLSFVLFVMFFPQLIAGPIVHHGEVIPQFSRPDAARPCWDNLAVGFTLLIFGLGKKVLLADPLSERVGEMFDAAAAGTPIPLSGAWYAVLAYALQIYFDFSGYTDMAIGLGRMFNITLPLNFNSPYQSVNVVEFWRRWHMTLSRFLRDYLYIPLGGNRHGRLRRHVNLMATMFLGGLWHGANWTFIAWGLLHGLYLVLNHAWLEYKPRLRWLGRVWSPARWFTAHLLTLTAVIFAWILFRTDSVAAVVTMVQSLFGCGPPILSDGTLIPTSIKPERWIWLGMLYSVVLFAPNSQQICSRFRPALGMDDISEHPGLLRGRLLWQPTTRWAVYVAIVFVAAFLSLSTISEFIYWQF